MLLGGNIFLLSFETGCGFEIGVGQLICITQKQKSFFKTCKQAEHTNKNHFPKHTKQVEHKNKNHFQKHANIPKKKKKSFSKTCKTSRTQK
jgi:hypothetical protein